MTTKPMIQKRLCYKQSKVNYAQIAIYVVWKFSVISRKDDTIYLILKSKNFICN